MAKKKEEFSGLSSEVHLLSLTVSLYAIHVCMWLCLVDMAINVCMWLYTVYMAITFSHGTLCSGIPVTFTPIETPAAPLREGRSASMDEIVREGLTFTGSARESDSGTYNCTTVNGGPFSLQNTPDGVVLQLDSAGGAVSTTRNLQVVVQGNSQSSSSQNHVL